MRRASEDSPTRRPDLRLAALGLLILQLAWIVSVPPFRGSDEFDHAYRAAAVAHGEVMAPATSATRGTGAWVTVPRDMAAAARPECDRLPYTSAADCEPHGLGDGMVRLASGAGRYNPSYYLAVGWLSIPLEGTSALLAMRLLTALIACGLFYAALCALAACTSSRWAVLGAVVSTSPVAVYSASVVAANGLEIFAGLATWAGLQSALRVAPAQAGRAPAVAIVVGAVMLCVLRQLGPLWLLLIVALSLMTAVSPRTAVRRVQAHLSRSSYMALGLAAGAGVVWTLTNRSLVIGRAFGLEPQTVWETAARLPGWNLLWALQSIAAFPLRDQQAPAVVYIAIATLWLSLFALGVWRADRRLRAAILATFLLGLLVPSLITLRTFDDFGNAWQGRYGLPFSIGAVVLAGLALDGRLHGLVTAKILAPAGVLFAVGHVVGAVTVLVAELGESPMVGTGQWLQPSPVLISVVASAGALLMWGGAAGVGAKHPYTEEVLVDRR